MIPTTITHQHVLDAIAWIDRHEIPPGRESRKFHVRYNGKNYPPKYLVSMAYRFANGEEELPSGAFGGGKETNQFLRSLGFKVRRAGKQAHAGTSASNAQPADPGSTPPHSSAPTSGVTRAPHSGERCKECKRVVKELLEKNYGRVEVNHHIACGARPEDYANTPCQAALAEIFAALRKHRGCSDFVHAKALPASDFFVRHPGFLVEFDESQHFTELRRVALDHYPSDLSFGFDLREWKRLCRELDKTDNDPPYRDEQRAWYDTLRDFAPQLCNMPPTLRLYASEYEWCSLNPAEEMHVETFRQILGERASFWHIDFSIPNNAPLARIVIDGSWRGDERLAKKLLRDVCDRWPTNAHVRCLSTCGAFLVFEWPEAIPRQPDNRSPGEAAMRKIDEIAREHLNAVLDDDVLERLRKVSDFLTVGVDSRKPKISSTDNYLSDNHVELVYIVDLNSGDIQFTGKSYPTSKQAGGLFRVGNLHSHFVKLGGVSAMVLGCHDLTIFSPRSDAKVFTPWRIETKREFKRLTKELRPEWVLHHPHTTVTPKTWRQAWIALSDTRVYPSIKSYLGTGCYSYRDSRKGLDRRPLESVLAKTKSPDVADIVVHLGMPGPAKE